MKGRSNNESNRQAQKECGNSEAPTLQYRWGKEAGQLHRQESDIPRSRKNPGYSPQSEKGGIMHARRKPRKSQSGTAGPGGHN